MSCNVIIWRVESCIVAALVLALGGCGSPVTRTESSLAAAELHPAASESRSSAQAGNPVSGAAHDIVFYALGLVQTGYRFGGKNPDAGLDCSGMVSHVFDQAAGIKLQGSAADIARRGKPVDSSAIKPGDLVFFNTLNKPFSHVGIYIGDGRFVHAPSSQGKVRVESLTSGWFAKRYEAARSYIDVN